MIKKGKRARITPDGEALIVSRALESHRLQRAVLAEKLQAEFEKRNYAVPQLEVLEKRISKYRNHQESPQDKPWSTTTLDAYPIPPEALPQVLALWMLRLKKKKSLTIREAKWAARLSATELGAETARTWIQSHKHPEDIYEGTIKGASNVEGRILERYSLIKAPAWDTMKDNEPPKGLGSLDVIVDLYARAERINEILGRPFDSEGIDRYLVGLPVTISFKRDIELDETGDITKVGKPHTTWEDKEGGTHERSHTSKG